MHVYFRGNLSQRLRLASGLVLFLFAATHFLNHALGLVSLEAMHQAQALRTSVTRSLPGTVILFSALVVHVVLTLIKLGRRTTWRIPKWEAMQIGFGLAIPFLLLPHIVNTRMAHTFFAVDDSYLYELTRLWPASAVQQSVLLLLVWTHGCMGLHYWLRLSAAYRRIAPVLLVGASALPLAAIAGFAVSGTITADIMSDPDALSQLKEQSNWPDAAESAVLERWRNSARIAFALALIATAAFVSIQSQRRRRQPGGIPVTYGSGRTIFLQPGRTILEASRDAGIPHASVCGGRGRCSTCRIRIEKGGEQLLPPDDGEAITLRSIDAPANVRLACQVRPTSPISIALVSAPQTHAPLEREFAEVREFVGYHVRSKLAGQLVEFASNDVGHIRAWLEERVEYHIPDIQFSDRSVELAGARLDYLGKRAIAVVVFGRDPDWVSVSVIPAGTSKFDSINAVRNGYHVVGWSIGQSRLLAVTDPALSGVGHIADMTDEAALSDLEKRYRRVRTEEHGWFADRSEGERRGITVLTSESLSLDNAEKEPSR
ncbi:MAG: 2Fe-2S iron-sulfur cluster-binding protein [Hyphomicrobiaceae bacterium]